MELIKIFADKVLKQIIEEVQQCKYLSISVDSTPDITHTDQLSITIRYVLPTGPVERFLGFVPLSSHTGEIIADIILNFLQEKSIDIKYCRGQSYANASNMSGKYKGVQQRINCVCPNADFCPCFAHSLNLVGTCAVESNADAAALSWLIQRVYGQIHTKSYTFLTFNTCYKCIMYRPSSQNMILIIIHIIF